MVKLTLVAVPDAECDARIGRVIQARNLDQWRWGSTATARDSQLSTLHVELGLADMTLVDGDVFGL